MQFEYEIPVDEYAAAQVLYYKAYAKGKSVKRTLRWVLLDLFCFVTSSTPTSPRVQHLHTDQRSVRRTHL